MASVTLQVNGAPYTIEVSSIEMPLLWALRDLLNLKSVKYGCGEELCGACAVIVNGQKELSCDMSVGEAVGRDIWTLEGLRQNNDPNYLKVEKAWVDNQVPQCGYCQPGMVVAAVVGLRAGAHGSTLASKLNHVCVCGTYDRIKKATQSL